MKIFSKKIILIVLAILTSLLIIAFSIFSIKSQNRDNKNEEKQICIIQFESSGGTMTNVKKINCGETIEQPQNPSKHGFEFEGWYLDDKIFDFSTPINKDIILVAKYTALENVEIVTVTFDSNGGNNSINSIEILRNTTIYKPVNPSKKNYSFQGWYLDDKKFDFSTNITENITLVAKWKKQEVIIGNLEANQTTENKNNNSNNNQSTPSNNKEKKYQYVYQYDAFEEIKCQYKEFSYKSELGLCYDTKPIKAQSSLECTDGYKQNSNGSCYKEIESRAPSNLYCRNEGEVLTDSGWCETYKRLTYNASSRCPDGYFKNTIDGKLVCENNEMTNIIDIEYYCDEWESVTTAQRDCNLINENGKWRCNCEHVFRASHAQEYYCENGLELRDDKCYGTFYKEKEKVYSCPFGYELSGDTCYPDPNIRYAKYEIEYDCLEGEYDGFTRVMIDNKCYDRYEIK